MLFLIFSCVSLAVLLLWHAGQNGRLDEYSKWPLTGCGLEGCFEMASGWDWVNVGEACSCRLLAKETKHVVSPDF